MARPVHAAQRESAGRAIGPVERAKWATGILLPAALGGQSAATSAAPDGVMLVFPRFADIFGGRLVAAFDSIPAARYEYRPMPTQQTIGYIARHLEDANYGLCEQLGMVPPSALPARRRTAIAMTASALSKAVGVYEVAPGLELHVTMENEALFIRSTTGGGAVHLWPETANDFFVNEADGGGDERATRGLTVRDRRCLRAGLTFAASRPAECPRNPGTLAPGCRRRRR